MIKLSSVINFGGMGKLKLPCEAKECLQPLLPLKICCDICGLDGWFAETKMRLVKRPPGTCALMECTLCKAIVHPTCMPDFEVDGFIKLDLPNSWECPKCIKVWVDAKAKAAEVKQEEEGEQVDSNVVS